ncbi:MAG: RNA methyltransferase [Chloroflexi bacterium]|nr:RNA methyltransferase [Anaerolineaceae bacterium]NMB89120.1 RNA methyltransferase [Chloroflexota bacterium]
MITSTQNPRIQQVRALLNRRKDRYDAQAFVVEGVRLAEEAIQAGWQAEQILFSEQLSPRGREILAAAPKGTEIEQIAPHVMDSLSATETSQGILAVFPMRRLPLPALDNALIVDTLRDPGNLGTLLRTAAAAGVQAVLLSPGTTDPFAPKVVRAGMGAHFKLPIYSLEWDEIAATCQGKLTIYLADVGRGSVFWQTDLRRPLALIVSNEAEGASPQAAALANASIHIPMHRGNESLNAAIAAGILLFEIQRQRSQ